MSAVAARVRLATRHDVPSLSALAHRTFVATYADQNPPGLVDAHADATFTLDRQAAELAAPGMTTLVAEEDGALVGYALLADTPPPEEVVVAHAPLQLARLYVDAPAQGRGVGSALLGQAIRVAAAAKYDRLWLTVWSRNPRAIAAYARWGFTDVGRTVFEMAGDRQVDRVMVLPVPGA